MSVGAHLRRAKARLVNMTVHEVSLVDRAANEHRFLVTKRDEDMPRKAKTEKNDAATQSAEAATASAESAQADAKDANAEEASKALVLPPDVKTLLVDALTGAIEKLSAIAMTVGEAATEEGAQTPTEIFDVLRAAGEEIKAVVDQLAPATPPAPDGEGGASAEASADAMAETAAQPAAPSGGEELVGAIRQAFEAALQSVGLKKADSTPPASPAPAAPPPAPAPAATNTATTKSLESKVDELIGLMRGVYARDFVAKGAVVPNSQEPSGSPPRAATVRWPSDMSELAK